MNLVSAQQRRVLEKFGPASVLVDREGAIVNACGRLGKYLESTEGGPVGGNLIRLARDRLRLHLRAALHLAWTERREVVMDGLQVGSDAEIQSFDLVVEPFASEDAALLLVVFRNHGPARPGEIGGEVVRSGFNEELLAMNEELQLAKDELQAELEELERARAWALARQRQQAAIARLGAQVLADVQLGQLFDEAMQMVAEVVGTDYCKVLELDPESGQLLMRSGIGWTPGLIGRAKVPPAPDSQAGFTLTHEGAVIVEDFARERRFVAPALLREHRVVSGISCTIRDATHVFGVLGAHHGEARSFSQDDANFVEAVANVLGHAVTRHRVLRRVTVEHALSQLLVDAQDIELVAPRMLEILARSLDATVAELWVQKGARLRREHVFVVDDDAQEAAAELDMEFEVGVGLVGKAWAEQRALQWSELERSSFRRKPAARNHGLTSGLALPITFEGETLALLCFLTRERVMLDTGLLESFARINHELSLFVRRVRAEQRLKHSEQRYRQIFESVGVSLWEQDFSEVINALDELRSQGVSDFEAYLDTHPGAAHQLISRVRKLDVNQATLRMFGARDKQEVLDERRPRFISQSPALMRGILLTLARGEPTFQGEVQFRTLDDRTIDVALAISFPPIAPSYRRVIVSLTDISEIKRTEAELLRAHQALSLAQRASRSGVFDWDVLADRVYWSPEFYEVFGLPASQEPSIEAWRARIHPDDRERLADEHERMLAPGEASEWGYEFRTHHPELGLCWIRSRSKIKRDPRGQVLRVTGLALDITETKQIEQALRESDEHKDRFLAMLGHELRNPVSAVQSAAEVLRLMPSLDLQIDRAQQVINRQTHHMSRLIDGLLDVSRIARNKMRLELAHVDLRERVEHLLHDRGDLVRARGLVLDARLADEPCWVEGDPTRLFQVIDNLVSNAIKFTDPPGTITIELRPAGGDVELVVSDTGIGIDDEVRKHMFLPFRQADQNIDRAAGGLGLGLALVKGLTELHQGSVEAHSRGRGYGSSFVVRLPRVDPPALVEPRAKPTKGPVLAREILIVEDNRDAAEMLCDLLTLLGHRVRVSHDGQHALTSASERAPDLVFCDIGLPGELDGYQVARRFRAAPRLRDVQLIALTGYGLPEDAEEALAAGFDAHLRKPIDLPTIEALMTAPPRRA